MRRARAAAGAAAIAAVSAAGVALSARKTIERWRSNPDPLGGIPIAFPAGTVEVVETSDGARINTISAGSGRPIVLVHGLTASRHDWGPVAGQLVERGVRVIAVEQRGHGDSTVGSDGFGPTQMAADLAMVLERLDLRDATLVGHSMGGIASLSLAVERPELIAERVSRLVLVSTMASTRDAVHQVSTRLGGLAILDHTRKLEDRLLLATGLLGFGRNPSLFMVEQAHESYWRCPDEVRRASTTALRTYDVEDRLGSVDVPTLVVAGTHDRIVPIKGSEVVAAAIPGARFEVVEGAGHLVFWERVDLLADLIATF